MASNEILTETISYIESLRDLRSICVEDLHVISPFTVVRLNDGSIGSASNYLIQNRVPDFDYKATRNEFLRCVPSDPLLLRTLGRRDSLLDLSILTAIVSALSQPLFEMSPPAGQDFEIAPLTVPHDWVRERIRPRDRVAVVGYGGPVSYLWNDERIARLDIFENLMAQSGIAQTIENEVKAQCGRQEIVKLHARADERLLGSASVCLVTASALCNNSLSTLLRYCSGARELIVQGPSASIVPTALFRRGCTTLLTTRKDEEEFKAGTQPTEAIYEYVDRYYYRLWPR